MDMNKQTTQDIGNPLTPDQRERYSRQIILPEIGEEGQLRLLKSRVLLVGAGGLGSPIALYLTAAGIGTLGIVDFDTVDISNIHRQLLYATDHVGKPKTEAARQTLSRINPEVSITAYQQHVTPEYAAELVAGYDIIVDASDNIATKFLLNDASFFAGKPYVFGRATRFNGNVSTFFPKEGGPCLRCMIPENQHPPRKGVTGVLGVIPGQIGMLQAAEVIKFLLGKGKLLTGQFMTYNCLETEFKTFPIKKNPACPLCSERPSIKDIKSGNHIRPQAH